MKFGTELKLKKDWEYNDIVTFEKGDTFKVAEYQHKYGMKLHYPSLSLVDFKFNWHDRDSKIDEYFEVVEMYDDRLAELEKVILDYYLAKGYQVGKYAFNVEINSDYKSKKLAVWFHGNDDLPYSNIFTVIKTNTNEMFDKAFEYFAIKKEVQDEK
jgi:hypothetical protein